MIAPSARAAPQTPRRPATGSAWDTRSTELRHSPLTQITKAQRRPPRTRLHRRLPRDRRGRAPRRAVVPARRQRTIYVTTDDDNVCALDATTGRSSGATSPTNTALFANFGIVANRGVAYCDGRLFLATLDMHLVALNAATGQLLARVPVGSAVPVRRRTTATRETSAPMCANTARCRRGRLGVRGPRLRDGVAHGPDAGLGEPVLDDPAGADRVAQARALVGGGAVWTPVTSTRRRTRSTSAPARRRRSTSQAPPGPAPRTDSLIAVDLTTGRLKWWRQQMATTSGRTTPRSRRSSTREGRRQDAPHRLRGDDGRRLVRVRRATGSRSTSASR